MNRAMDSMAGFMIDELETKISKARDASSISAKGAQRRELTMFHGEHCSRSCQQL